MADKKISALTAATTPLAGTEVLPIVQGGATVKVSVDNLTDGKTVLANKFYALSTETTPIDTRRSVANNTNLATIADSPSLSNTSYVLFGIDTTGGSVGYSTSGAFVSTGSNGTGTARPLILHTYGNNDIVFARQNTAIGSITANGFAPVSGKGIDFAATPGTGTSELLADYEEGAWTPTDGSGAGLSFTGTSGNCFYTKVGNLVTCVFALVYPSTASALAAKIAGLPFTTKSTTNTIYGGFTTYTDSSLSISFLAASNGTNADLYLNTGLSATNLQLSTRSVRGIIIYAV
jgi:hypothetical protein